MAHGGRSINIGGGMSFRGRTSRTRRMRLTLVGALVLLGLIGGAAVWSPLSSALPTCTDSWSNASGGDWWVAGNWSTNAVPVSTDDVCITLSGTYTVTLGGPTSSHAGGAASTTVKSLTIGGASGTQ